MAADAAAAAADDLALLVTAVRHAAAVAQRFAPLRVKVWEKADGTKVSVADIALDAALAEVLRPARPAYGWLSEEGTERIAGARSFVCDPIDGTNGFLRGEASWTIVAAVIEDGRPVAGAILRPGRDRLYAASIAAGATLDGTPIRIAAARASGARVAATGALFRDAGLSAAGMVRGPSYASLALRLAKVASGELDGVVTKPGPHHWDLAAADLILHEAGGSLTSLDGTLLRYDGAATAHGSVVAGSPALCAALRRFAAPHVAA